MRDKTLHADIGPYKKTLCILARVILGGVFIYASVYKIAFPREFVNVVVSYHLVPDTLAVWVAYLLPWGELCLGIAAVIGFRVKEATLMMCALLLFFLAATGLRSLAGPLKACGCFPRNSPLATTDIRLIVLRDSLFFSLGILILLLGRRRPKSLWGKEPV